MSFNMILTWGPTCDFIFLEYLIFKIDGQLDNGLSSS